MSVIIDVVAEMCWWQLGDDKYLTLNHPDFPVIIKLTIGNMKMNNVDVNQASTLQASSLQGNEIRIGENEISVMLV